MDSGASAVPSVGFSAFGALWGFEERGFRVADEEKARGRVRLGEDPVVAAQLGLREVGTWPR